MNLSTVKWAQWDKTQSRELLGLFICVCSSLCTIVVHNTAQNRPDNFPSCPPDSHPHSSAWVDSAFQRHALLSSHISCQLAVWSGFVWRVLLDAESREPSAQCRCGVTAASRRVLATEQRCVDGRTGQFDSVIVSSAVWSALNVRPRKTCFS